MTAQEQERAPDLDSREATGDPLLRGTSYSPSRESSHRIRLQIPSRPEHIQPVREFVYRLCRGCGFTALSAFDMKLITGEALANIIKHAYGRPGKTGTADDAAGRPGDSGSIFIDVLFFKTFVELRFRDFGRHPVEGRDLARDMTEYRESGLGLYLIQSLSDYHYFDRTASRGTLLVVKKRIG